MPFFRVVFFFLTGYFPVFLLAFFLVAAAPLVAIEPSLKTTIYYRVEPKVVDRKNSAQA